MIDKDSIGIRVVAVDQIWKEDDSHFDSILYTKRLANFVIAQISLAPEEGVLIAAAGEVLVFQNGNFLRVRDIAEKAKKHGWNVMIYEAWCWEYRNQILNYQTKLNPLEFEALYTFANADSELDITLSDVNDAVNQAHRDVEDYSDCCENSD